MSLKQTAGSTSCPWTTVLVFSLKKQNKKSILIDDNDDDVHYFLTLDISLLNLLKKSRRKYVIKQKKRVRNFCLDQITVGTVFIQ